MPLPRYYVCKTVPGNVDIELIFFFLRRLLPGRINVVETKLLNPVVKNKSDTDIVFSWSTPLPVGHKDRQSTD